MTRNKFSIQEWIPQLMGLTLYGEILCGNFYVTNPIRSVPPTCPVVFVDLKNETLPDHTENCLKWASFNTKLLNGLFATIGEDGKDDQVDSECLAELPYVLNYITLNASFGRVYTHHYQSVSERGGSVYKLVDCCLLRRSLIIIFRRQGITKVVRERSIF